jgi:hypothetical protein
MRLFISAAVIATLCCSSCVALDQETSKPPKTKPITRVTAFAKQVSDAVTELTRETVPVVKAVNDEVSKELRSDLKKVREEWSLQVRRALPSRANPNTP